MRLITRWLFGAPEQRRWSNPRAVQFKIELDSLLRLLVDDLQLTYEPEARRLVAYRGISNVHNPATGKPYNARIVYTDQAPEGAPDDLPPLTGR